jgi:hypothetical protein
MVEVKKQTAIVFIESNRISFLIKDTRDILQLDLPLDTISNLEVLSRDKLGQLIDSFFQTNGFKDIELDIILVFSQDVAFEKDFVDDAVKVKDEEIQKFLDMVPFEDVLSKIYKFNKKIKVVAINKVLFDVVHLCLEKNKAHVSIAVPMTVLAETNPELSNNVDLAFIMAKVDSFNQYSFIEVKQGGVEGEQKNAMGIKKKDIRLYALLGVFALLFIILAILIYTTFLSSPKINPNQAILPKTPIISTTTTQTIPLASSSATISSPSSLLQAH